jgi:hypothetical protein
MLLISRYSPDQQDWRQITGCLWTSMDEKSRAALLIALHVDDYGVFMFYWYSGLYVVIEGYQELKLHGEKIDALLQSPNVDLLKRLRHGTFHFQNNLSVGKSFPHCCGRFSNVDSFAH